MDQIIPLDTAPNQIFQMPVSIDKGLLVLTVNLRYNEIAKYWVATIRDKKGVLLLDSVPLLTGNAPACNILKQFSYLGIGSAYIINASGTAQDVPDNKSLGTDFLLIWSDTP